MSYQFVRRLMLDQSWIHDAFYVKPLQFTSNETSRTFYFTAEGPAGSHYGIIGELLKSTVDTSKVLQSINTFFKEAISEGSDDTQVFEALCKKMDDTFSAISLTFQMWSRLLNTSYVSVISMGMQMLRFVTKDFQDVKLSNSTKAYESRKVKKYVRDEVRLQQAQFMMLATNGFAQPSYINRPDSIFELSSQLSDLFFYKAYKNPEASKDACVLLIDFNKFDQTHEFMLHGFETLDLEIDDILKVVPPYHDHFAARLVLSDLLMNAFKQGNGRDVNLPIKVIIGINTDEIYIEVFDMTVRTETLSNKSTMDHEYLLDEYDRGLFLVNTFSNDVFIDNNSITSRIKRK